MLMAVLTINAQTALKKVYDENIDPMEQIDKALVKAKAEGKYVVCQVGGTGVRGVCDLPTLQRKTRLSTR